MSQLLGMSFDAPSSPSMSLAPWQGGDEDAAPSGWGFGWYPADDYAAVVIKDPYSVGDTALSRVLTDWERFRGTVFICHIRGAAKRVTQQDTHPFFARYSGRQFLLAHSGDLQRTYREDLPLGDVPLFEPIGRTDSEWMLCWLLTQLRGYGCRRLADLGWHRLHELFKRINEHGVTNVLISDGQDLVAYRDRDSAGSLHVMRRVPPHDDEPLEASSLKLSLADPLDHNRTVVVLSTIPLSSGFRPMQPGEMLVARRGAITYTTHPDAVHTTAAPATQRADGAGWVETPTQHNTPLPLATGAPAPVVAQAQAQNTDPPAAAPAKAKAERILRVVHETFYTYAQPVELSTHVFRLRPVDDVFQDVIEHDLTITPTRPSRDFEDVFGNATRRMKIDIPFTELKITSTSLIRVRPKPRLTSVDRRTSIPLVWMPWQRQMMSPYLLPPELPESQLRELSQFAMSFVERQDYNLVDTIHDINSTIYRDFKYVSGSTNLATTAFDVYINRRGVCQDFANLFICLTRLLGVPARYRVGYIHTGADYANKIQSEASHAWTEVYLPWIGWYGFDPTNGCAEGPDHIRVAVGRNYHDATPTQGTLYKGGSKETLSVSVRVEVVDEQGELVAGESATSRP